ncbi:hypothetical protein [Actinoplanes sp. M2I2]|uniref:hypothetical protein n=1 Tax=Actinoplanes sp. M2I2 TaxID=1734444 RepID=UPI00202025C3|nr:hypothetical protein [Actinoplanes sp. M2I2]
MTTDPFWIDHDYDRDYASDGRSRYEHYLRDAAGAFDEIWANDPSVEFAAAAWRIANGPIMAPGLVRHHPQIVEASALRSDWNSRMLGSVRLVAPCPRQLAELRTPAGGWYRDVRLDSWNDRYEGVGGRDLEQAAYLTTEVQVLWQFPDDAVPKISAVPPAGDRRYRHAMACVTALIAEFNRQVRPIIAAAVL